MTKKKDPKDILPCGAKRKWSPSDEELVKLGMEMVEWVKVNKPTHLSEFWSLEKWILRENWKRLMQIPAFLPYYDIALAYVALSARDGTLEKSIAQRFMSLYHLDLRDQEREIAKEKKSVDVPQKVIIEHRQQSKD